MRGVPGDCKPRKDGYVVQTINGIRKMQHIRIWEEANGPIPYGHHIHHKNGDRSDNRLSNLECIKPLDHKRLHAGCYKKRGRWIRKCPTCKKHLDLEKSFYGSSYSKGFAPMNECKSCHVKSGLIRRNRQKIATAKKALQKLLKGRVKK